MSKIVNGIMLQQFIKGWWGENDEGVLLLQSLGLSNSCIPFDVENFLKTNEFSIDLNNNVSALVNINKQDAYYEFVCKYPNKKYHFKLFREWDGVDVDTIIKMESYAVGECTRKILTSRSIL